MNMAGLVFLTISTLLAFTQTPSVAPRTPGKPQPRAHAGRVVVDPKLIDVDDGDTIEIRWKAGDVEDVRVLGIDCPETRHLRHDIPIAQPFGEEARAFALGTFAAATRVEIVRAANLDQYGRTLAYVFVDGRNYSVLVVRARLADETVTAFGDNGFPKEAAIVLDTAKQAGPMPFEPPYLYRNRMRKLADWMKANGTYPAQ
jgi:endonuclease YncB( thermonuclease family)